MLAENLPTALMGIASNKDIVVIHYPSLIKLVCTPAKNLTSHPEASFGKINEAEIVGFKGLHLNELHALDFSA